MRNRKAPFQLKAIALTVLASIAVSELHAAALEEIIVSARKTEENVQNIPIALDAISNQIISEKGVSDIADVASLSAGLVFDEGLLPNDTRPVIRGLSATRGRANVATLIDDVDVTSESLTIGGGGMTGNMRLMDLERVEVVKGPQSVLYGRSAFTGAVNYVNKRPDQEFGGQIDADINEFGTTETKLGVTGGLTDELAARLNLANWNSEGWDYQNPNTGDDLNTGDMNGGSLALEWMPTDEFTAYTRVDYSDEEYGPRAQVFKRSLLNDPKGALGTGVVNEGAELKPFEFSAANVAQCADSANRSIPFTDLTIYGGGGPGPLCRPILTGSLEANEDEIDLSADPLTGNDYRGTELETLRGHLDLRWELEDSEFRSITGYTENKVNIQEDFDLTDYELLPYTGGELLGGFGFASQIGYQAETDITHDLNQLSQEFRYLGSSDQWNWFVSALYWNEELDTTWDDRWYSRGGDITQQFFGVLNAPDYSLPSTLISRETDHVSLAGSLGYQITDDVKITVEGRYLEEDIDYSGTNEDRGAYSATGGVYCDFGFFGPPPYNVTPCGTSENEITVYEFVPRTSIDWQINEDVLSYFTYAEGFKPGGINTTDANGDVSEGEYDPESLKTYELGLKTAWMENRLQLNGSFFFYDYTDLQQSIQTLGAGNVTTTAVVNAGAVENKGFELDATMAVTDELTLSFGYVMSDATYEDFDLLKISSDNLKPGEAAYVAPNNQADAGNASGNFDGNQLPLSAKHAMTVGVRYETEIQSGLTTFVEFDGNVQSQRYISPGNNASLPRYDVWNLSGGFDAEQWRVIAYVDNLFDDDTIRSGLSNTDYGFFPDGGSVSNAANLVLPQPRTIGIRGTYRF